MAQCVRRFRNVLDYPGFENLWGSDFFRSIQTASEAHPTSCTMGNKPSSRGYRDRSVNLKTNTFLGPGDQIGGSLPPPNLSGSLVCYETAFTFTPLAINKRNYI